MSNQTQETRSMIVALKVTPSEKLRLEWVAGMRGVDLSTLMRTMGIEDAMREHKRLVAAVEQTVAAEEGRAA